MCDIIHVVWYNSGVIVIQFKYTWDIIQWYMWYNSRIKVEYHIVLKVVFIQF